MPVDSNIALSIRPVDAPNQLAQYAQLMAIQSAGNQNALTQYSLGRAKREDEVQNALAAAYRGAVTPEGSIDYNKLTGALAGGAAATSIPGVLKSRNEQQRSEADLDKVRLDNIRGKLGLLGGALAPLAQNPTREAVMGTLANLKAQGVDPAPIPLPANDADLPRWIAEQAAATEHGLKALEAYMPKVTYVDAGGARVPVNQNLLAAPIGPMAGIASIGKTATPGEIMTDVRGREFNATQQAAVAATRANTQANRDIAREQTQAQREIGNASNIRDEQTKALKRIDEVQQKLTIAKQLLATSSPASDIQLQQALTDLFDNARATNMLFNANKNFGTLAGRATGLIGRMFTGQYTDKQRSEIQNLITDMEKNVLSPTRSRVESHYKGIAQATGVNPALTQTPNFYSDQSSGSPQAEADAFLRGAANAKPR